MRRNYLKAYKTVLAVPFRGIYVTPAHRSLPWFVALGFQWSQNGNNSKGVAISRPELPPYRMQCVSIRDAHRNVWLAAVYADEKQIMPSLNVDLAQFDNQAYRSR